MEIGDTTTFFSQSENYNTRGWWFCCGKNLVPTIKDLKVIILRITKLVIEAIMWFNIAFVNLHD